MAFRLLCALAIAFVVVSMAQDEASGRAGAIYWRARSLDKVPLEGWVLSKMEMFTSQNGSGEASTGEPLSSTWRGMSDTPPGTEFTADKAFDGSEDTIWESEDGEPGQWIGLKFAEKTDIQSMVMRTPDMVKGPSGVIIEKSDDGETWGRVAEITDMRDWGIKDQLYKLVPMDQLPPSVFAIRSQFDTAWCVGVRTRMQDPDDEDSPIIDVEEGAVLELQKCLDDTVTQWWSFDVNRGILHNAKDSIWIVKPNGTVADGTGFSIGKCTDGCPEADDSKWMYSDSVLGGFLRSKASVGGVEQANIVLAPKGNEFKEGVELVFGKCGDDPNVPATLDTCDFKEAQWELLPMFALEEGKEAIKCAPYSHTLQKASNAATRQEAQRLCAADIKCSAYSWADSTGEQVNANTGKKDGGNPFADKVFLCHQLHDVHSGQTGWELGVRAGRAYDSPYEKLKQNRL
jgi:hypothetical protein